MERRKTLRRNWITAQDGYQPKLDKKSASGRPVPPKGGSGVPATPPVVKSDKY